MADHTDEKTIDAAERTVLDACALVRAFAADAIEAGAPPPDIALAMLIVGRQIAADVWGNLETEAYFRLVANALKGCPANEPEVISALH